MEKLKLVISYVVRLLQAQVIEIEKRNPKRPRTDSTTVQENK